MKKHSMKLSNYFEIVRPEYEYIRVQPHKSIKNTNTASLAKAIQATYRALDKRIYKQKKKLFFQCDWKVSHVMDIYKDHVDFYFIVPKPCLNSIFQQLSACWPKATLEIMEEKPKAFSKDAEIYQLSYSKEDALSLAITNKTETAQPLGDILSVLNIMEEKDRVAVIYNFLPTSQFSWTSRYMETMDKLAHNKLVLKKQNTTEYILKSIAVGTLNLISTIFNVIDDFTGGNSSKTGKDLNLYGDVVKAITQQNPTSRATNSKKAATVIDTQIAVVSESEDRNRKTENAVSVCQSFRCLDEDNTLIFKEVKKKQPINLEDTSIDTEISTMSCDEVGNFLQIPGRALLNRYNMNYIKNEENPVPKELTIGNKRLCLVKYKYTKQMAFFSMNYNIGNYPALYVGCQGSGKTTAMKHLVKDCINAGEGVIILDFIKACEYSESIIPLVPKDKLVVLDLSNFDKMQGFGFNEYVIKDDMDVHKKCDLASKQSQQIMAFINAISNEDDLTRRMRKYLNAACMICTLTHHNSIKDIVDFLSDHMIRHQYIEELSEDVAHELASKIKTLEELDEWSKPAKNSDEEPEIIGTKESKIEFILDRISLLEEDYKLSYMYEKGTEDNIDLVDCMDKGKVVILQMREIDFPSTMAKNIMTTYLISKVWLASQIRGAYHEEPLRCNFFIDELFQAPVCMETVARIIPQTRKVGLKFIFSTQYLTQLQPIIEAIDASGGTFMLLSGSTEKDFKFFRGKVDNFEYEDLRDMEKFSSMCIVKYEEGYSSFIGKLPYDKDLESQIGKYTENGNALQVVNSGTESPVKPKLTVIK